MKKNYKATININRESWDKFKSICIERGTTATEEICNFIDLFVLEKTTTGIDYVEYENYPQSIQTIYNILEGRLDTYIEKTTDNLEARLDDIEAKLDGLETDGETDKTDGLEADKTDGLGTDGETDKTYSDLEVAELEGKNRSTINRYRLGKRTNPDKSFYDRWKVSKDKSGWRKLSV